MSIISSSRNHLYLSSIKNEFKNKYEYNSNKKGDIISNNTSLDLAKRTLKNTKLLKSI